MKEKQTLYLYTTAGCHLCEMAAGLLAHTLDAERFSVEPVEISESEDLVERYGIRIPVIRLQDSTAELGWPFGPEDVIAFVDGGDR